MAWNFVYYLVSILACGLSQSNALQIPLSSGQNTFNNSNLIFASLHSLLKSWSQVYAPHGHAIVPVTIKTGTLLYNMGGKRPPPTMGYFAFDAEHSYHFGGGLRGAQAGDRTLYTFAASRPLHALYFDGFSAAKTGNGTLDLQNVLAYGKADDKHLGPDGEYESGQILCEWGKEFGVEGFVREEATFELFFCNFQDGVQLLDAADMTIASSSPESPPLKFPHICPWHHPLHMWLPPTICALDEPRDVFTPYAIQGIWSFYHAASWHHHVPETRITLHPAYLTSLYDPSYSSLVANNQLPVRKHRLTDLSPENITAFEAEVTQALTQWRNDQYGSLGSGIDWSAIAQAVVDRNGDRISEMQAVLGNISSTSNITKAIAHVRLIAFALVMPYIDHRSVLTTNTTVEARSSSLVRATDHCSTAFTRHLEIPFVELTPQERRLKDAIEGVLTRICNLGTSVLGDSLTLLDMLENDSRDGAGQDDGIQMLNKWNNNVKNLMDWLGWAMWKRCPRACAWDELCYVPMWPIWIRRHDPDEYVPIDIAEDELEPRCANKDWFEMPVL